MAVVIVVLLGVIVFWKPASAPTNTPPPQTISSYDGTLSLTTPPAIDTPVTSPLAIEGTATGNWFNEATFPIKVLDGDGRVLGSGQAQALGNWMTTGTVQFSASIPFVTPKYATGTVEFKNDNPSGLPINAKEFDLEVQFQKAASST